MICDTAMGMCIDYCPILISSPFSDAISAIYYVITDELKTTTTELVYLMQAKVGTTNFAAVYNQVRQSALNVRQERHVACTTQVK